MEFQIGTYQDKVLCDVMPMDVCHMLLGRPWKFDMRVVYDGRANTCTFEKDGVKHTLIPSKDENLEEQKVLLVGGKEFLHEIKDNEISSQW